MDSNCTPEEQALQLRQELKQWETTWAHEHGGAKPSRNDIKKNAAIAQKYTVYNRLRKGKLPKPANTATNHSIPKPADSNNGGSTGAKRKRHADTAPHTPSKRSQVLSTPKKSAFLDDSGMPNITPSASRRLFSPAVPTSIGPTPQRDGRVLGLFDVLSGTEENFLAATPSKNLTEQGDKHASLTLSTPPTSSARTVFTTPLAAHDNNIQPFTPSRKDVSPIKFATPAFLRRAPGPVSVNENGEFMSPPNRTRLPRKPLMRGLSSVLAGLRKMEDDELDDQLDVLHELEEEGTSTRPATQRTTQGTTGTKSQPVQMDAPPPPTAPVPPPRLLGGFDDEALYDSPPEEDTVRPGGQPLRIFKKKGQKRTTRFVQMKPVQTKRSTDDNEETSVGIGGSGNEQATSKSTPVAKKAARKVNELAHANFKRLQLRNKGSKGGPSFKSRFRRRR